MEVTWKLGNTYLKIQDCESGWDSLSATAPFFVRVRPDSNGFNLHFISVAAN